MDAATALSESYPLWSGANACAATHEAANSDYEYELAQRIAGGDMQAFEELYRRYHRRVYNLCLRMTNRGAEAEDLTQEIFIHVYRKIGGFRGESAMMTWLHRVTVNKVLMHFRRNAVRRERMTDDGESPEPAVKGAKTQSQTPMLDRLALERAIAQLSPGYRAVFLLHDVEGYEHAEVGRILGCSAGTSKSQLHKARKKLRGLLKSSGAA
jgi:RNA polymerase sigma-70 factor, ECF subfamily